MPLQPAVAAAAAAPELFGEAALHAPSNPASHIAPQSRAGGGDDYVGTLRQCRGGQVVAAAAPAAVTSEGGEKLVKPPEWQRGGLTGG